MDAAVEVAEAGIRDLLALLRSAGHCPTSFLALDRSKTLWQGRRGGFLAYRPVGRVDVILGDPMGPLDSAAECLVGFRERAARLGRQSVAIAATEDARQYYENAGFRGGECGAEATVDLDRFDLEAPERRNLRRSVRHARREGLEVAAVSAAELRTDGYSEEFRRITNLWLQRRKTGLLSFLVGAPFMPGWEACRHFVVYSRERMEAFGMFHPIGSGHSVYVDITRRRLDSPNGTTDLLLADSFQTLAAEGIRKAYLGMVPCTFPQGQPDALMAFVMKYAFRYFGALYPMRGEHFFKAKFATGWERRYAFFYPEMTARSLWAVYRVLWPGGLHDILGHKLASMAAA